MKSKNGIIKNNGMEVILWTLNVISWIPNQDINIFSIYGNQLKAHIDYIGYEKNSFHMLKGMASNWYQFCINRQFV
jgi:hypothetical protein